MKNILNSFLSFVIKFKEYLIIAIAYISLAVQKIANLGLNYDELLFTNVALGEVVKDLFITHKVDVFGLLVPLHNFYYIGVLKSALYYPIFEIFGTSAFSIRFPMVILTVFSLFLIFGILKKYLSKTVALLTTLVTAFSTDLIFYTTYDVGPVAIELFCKILLVLVMLSYISKPKIWKILSFCLVFFLGTFNKVNFLWSGNAILAVFAVVYLLNYFQIFKKLRAKLAILHLAIFLGGTSLSYIYWRWCSSLYNWTTSLSTASLVDNHSPRLYTTFNMIGGWDFFAWALDRVPALSNVFGICVLTTNTLGLLIILFHKRFADIRQFYTLFFGLFWTILIQQIATGSAGNPWHTFSSVFPFVPVCFGISIWAIWTLIFEERYLKFFKNIRLSSVAIVLSFFLIFGYQLAVYSSYHKQLDSEPKLTAWSRVFYDLADYLKNQDKKIIATDWGPTSGLMTLDQKEGKYIDYWNQNDGSYRPQVFDKFKTYLPNYQDYLVLSHGPNRRMFRDNINVTRFLQENGFKLYKVKEFVGERGVQYELFEMQKIQN